MEAGKVVDLIKKIGDGKEGEKRKEGLRELKR